MANGRGVIVKHGPVEYNSRDVEEGGEVEEGAGGRRGSSGATSLVVTRMDFGWKDGETNDVVCR